jgi:hypothetical protein
MDVLMILFPVNPSNLARSAGVRKGVTDIELVEEWLMTYDHHGVPSLPQSKSSKEHLNISISRSCKVITYTRPRDDCATSQTDLCANTTK